MGEERKAYYEAMFLIGQAQAADLSAAVEHIRELLGRAKAEIIAMRKWDERRLAYDIEKQRRGVYILTYFQADTGAITGLERDCNLSETVLRLLVLRADHMTEEEMRAQDDWEKLSTEAKMRSEQEAERAAAARERVTAGAPTDRQEGSAEKTTDSAEDSSAAETASPAVAGEPASEQG